ncbi:macro domain protein (macronuclear) [Tetrahymena thermophila SB210]|uniref:Macro domain protein n=1 Tax=Tetrahymena thermophila (strain SB210) TaxID=312017 RepID=I7M082_TETTS|nr:macro domain protein [Tetrahymena thermophila SB210]EAR85654.1 macro domain protein [Tetrahymena thermophila SB210]|eukprot:XP_001033317.1 macro domain protein [Tetrahymena thermophila SB210]
MGNLCRYEDSYQKSNSLRFSQSFSQYDVEQVKISNTNLTVVSLDIYKYLKFQKVDAILCIQDSHLEFPDKVFKNYVGDSVVKECKEYIKLHEDLILNKVMHTKGGKANCKYIIHGGYIKDTNENYDGDNLRRLITESLTHASDILECQTILLPLNQLKTRTVSTCASVILACQHYILENQNNKLRNIIFVGNQHEEQSIKLYRSALTANQKTELFDHNGFENSYDEIQKFEEFPNSNDINGKKNERAESKKLASSSCAQLDLQNYQTSINKSLIRTNSQSSQIKDLNTSQLNKSGKQAQKSKLYQEDQQMQFGEFEVQTDTEQEQQGSKIHRTSQQRQQSSQNLATRYHSSYESGIQKEMNVEKTKSMLKKELDHYNNPFENQINFEDQHQLQQSMLKAKKNRSKKMKKELMQTNITVGKDEDETLEKDEQFYDNIVEDSFDSQSGLGSQQITSLLNNKQQQYQPIDSLLYNVKLNLKQDSNDMQNFFINSNNQSHKFGSSSYQNIQSDV